MRIFAAKNNLMSVGRICNEGVVKELHESWAIVQLTVHSACAGCHAQKMCGATTQQHREVKVRRQPNQPLRVGETVRVSMQQSNGRAAVIIAYFLPFIVLISTLSITFYLTKSQLLSVLVTLLLVAAYFAALFLFGKKLEKKFVFSIEKMEDAHIAVSSSNENSN